MNERYQRITQALNIFEISDKYPSDISGGRDKEHPRVHLLRILRLFSRMSQQGHLILKYSRFITTFSKINELYNATIVMVTHDPLAQASQSV